MLVKSRYLELFKVYGTKIITLRKIVLNKQILCKYKLNTQSKFQVNVPGTVCDAS